MRPWSLYSGSAASPASAYDILGRGQDGRRHLAWPSGGSGLPKILQGIRTARSHAPRGPPSHPGRHDGPWFQPPALPAHRGGPLDHAADHVEAGQGVQGAAAGDPATGYEIAAPFPIRSRRWPPKTHRPTTPRRGWRLSFVRPYTTDATWPWPPGMVRIRAPSESSPESWPCPRVLFADLPSRSGKL